MEYQIHPIALLVPEMKPEEYENLKADIMLGGLHCSIELYDGQIVDGRHRYKACRELEITPHFKILEGEWTEGMLQKRIWTLNVERRHLGEGARTAIHIDFAERLVAEGNRRREEQPHNGNNGQFTVGPQAAPRAAEVAAKEAGVGKTTMNNGLRVKREGTPELFEAMKQGSIAVATAATLTELTPEEQLAVVAEPKRAPTVAKNVKRQSQRAKIAALATASIEDPEGMFAVVYADPPWEYDNTVSSGSVANEHPTANVEKLAALKEMIEKIAFPDCVLFLWATSPCLPEALETIRAWGFQYKASAVWNKGRGMGNYFRIHHEFLLLAVKGKIPTPDTDKRPDSVFDFEPGEHSEKPELVYGLIELMYPELPKIELFARKARPGWVSWGLEAPALIEEKI